jgi:ligand-binding sensor domain-containing protein
MKYVKLVAPFVFFIVCTFSKAQNKTDLPAYNTNPEIKVVTTSYVPNRITRNIIQDRKGNIWIASWDGIFRYDGKSFINITGKVSSARFFAILEDRKGNLWFSTIGSGIFLYNGNSFRNFTTTHGLADNQVTCIYEDKAGNIWFGTESGASCYDGKSFKNYKMDNELPNNGKLLPDFGPREAVLNNRVNSIIEEKTGKFWFGTVGNAFVYHGKSFTLATNNEGKAFKAHSIVKDRKGNIWLGGKDGLWRYDGSTYTNFSQNNIGYIMEDKKGNIWISADGPRGMELSRYEAKSLFREKTTVVESSQLMGGIFGICENYDGSIWFGASSGVYQYDGNIITGFKNKELQK